MPKPKTPLLAADCVVFDAKGRVLLIRRRHPPFKGALRAPRRLRRHRGDGGGRLPARAGRGDRAPRGRLRLVGIYSDPKRDPRGHTCSAVFLAQVARGEPQGRRRRGGGRVDRGLAQGRSRLRSRRGVLADARKMARPAPQRRSRKRE